MNGTQLYRRSASIVLACSFLSIAACSVELGGLFEGDADIDGTAPRDAGQDAQSTDRAPDSRIDVTSDSSTADGRAGDSSSTDGSLDQRGGGDATGDAIPDGSGADALRDGSPDGNVPRDASLDADASRDPAFDGEGNLDSSTDPIEDGTAEDTTSDSRLDVAVDTDADVAADAITDISPDRADAGPPGTCGGTCNTFANIGQTITRTIDQGSPPPMTGGMLVDGTYVATSIVQYNGDPAPYSLSETSVIAGNIDTWIASMNGQPQVRYTTTITTTGNQLAFTFCCPTTGSFTILYTTDGTTLTHIDVANPNRVITYTRQ
ncbi:MAG TPA: hypothetical protein VK550_07715 [Polyangiaceae bacterium]|nr:hypothetical protein [Polyangiaceae bacterium]